MSLTKVSYSMITGSLANVLDYGADPTGIDDSASAIQNAIDANASIYIPEGTYKTTASILIDDTKTIYGAGTGSTVIKPTTSVLEAVKVGSVTLFTGCIKNLTVDRTTYSGATENVGFAYYDAAECVFESIESRYSKYNHKLCPSTGKRAAYNTWINATAVGGYYNIYVTGSGTGFANENSFYGGRLFTTSDTNTNVHATIGNHNRWIDVCAEGEGDQAFLIGDATAGVHSTMIFSPRCEGTWVNAAVVIQAGAQNTTVIANDFYTTVTDNGTGTVFFTRRGTQINGVLDFDPVLTLGTSQTGDAIIQQIRSGYFSSTNKPWQVVNDSDDQELANLDGVGRLTTRTGFTATNASWNFEPLVLENYRLWVSATAPNAGKLMIKNGIPTSDNDGTVVGSQ
jgi:hypothetical protein